MDLEYSELTIVFTRKYRDYGIVNTTFSLSLINQLRFIFNCNYLLLPIKMEFPRSIFFIIFKCIRWTAL